MIKLFTHTDLDGVGCMVVAKAMIEDSNNKIDVSYCDYNSIDNEVRKNIDELKKYSDIFITDISINEETVKMLIDKNISVYGLDHHKTAEWLNIYSNWIVREYDELAGIKTCGTELYYNWIIDNDMSDENKTVERFVEIVRDYDTWRWTKIEDGLISKQLNDLLSLYGRERFIEWCLDEIRKGEFPVLHDDDVLALKIQQEEIDAYVEKKNKEIISKKILRYKGGIVFADRYISELGNRLCNKNPEYDFIVMINIENGSISYRTTKNYIDVSQIAKEFNGGGHTKASGSTFDKGALQNYIIKTLINK